jgi:hypothetical protein
MPDAIACKLEAVLAVTDGRVYLRGLFSRDCTRAVALPPLESIQHVGYLSARLV